MLQEVKMTDEEKTAMYMKSTKKELIGMLIQCNKILNSFSVNAWGDKIDDTKVYEFLYTTCIYKSAAATQSLHRTKEGAYKAMRKFILKLYEDWFNDWLERGGRRKGNLNKIGIHEAWFIKEIILTNE